MPINLLKNPQIRSENLNGALQTESFDQVQANITRGIRKPVILTPDHVPHGEMSAAQANIIGVGIISKGYP